jgi:branched-chain amino acid transport system permease protein
MSNDVRGVPDRVVDLFEGNDPLLIVGTMLGIYVLLTAAAVAVGFDLNGIVNTLRAATVFAAGYGMLVLALNLHWGYTGLFNIGVAGFMAVGTYVTAMLSAAPSSSPPGLGLPLPVAILGGMAAAAIVGLLTALPALRLRADYLAIVTVALSEMIRLFVKSRIAQEFTVAGVTLGTGGGRGINYPSPQTIVTGLLVKEPRSPGSEPTAFGEAVFGAAESVGISESVVSGLFYLVLLLVFTGAFYWLLVRIANSPFGRVLKAIREDELVASSLGKDTRLFKLKVFAVGCALMGLGGYLWIGRSGYVNDLSFRPNITFFVFIALIIGGAGSNTGSILGGMVFSALLFYFPQFVSQNLGGGSAPDSFAAALGSAGDLFAYAVANVSSLRFVAIGILLVYLMQNRPEGILGHRKEDAASVDLLERGSGRRPAADGGRPPDSGGESDE